MLNCFRLSEFLSLRKRLWLSLCSLLLLTFVWPHLLWAQEIAQVKKGVVKITTHVERQQLKVGASFIVRLEKDAAYIVTASYVIEGDEIETVS